MQGSQLCMGGTGEGKCVHLPMNVYVKWAHVFAKQCTHGASVYRYICLCLCVGCEGCYAAMSYSLRVRGICQRVHVMGL